MLRTDNNKFNHLVIKITMENQYIENIKKGLKVEIVTKQHKLVKGFVEDLAAREKFHVNGIMVRLKTGEIGRVQKIILNNEQKNDKNTSEILELIKKGENFNSEFKKSILWSQFYSHEQIKESKSTELRDFGVKASKVIIAKSIVSFLNSEGGNLLIGVEEKKDSKERYEIIGINDDILKVKDSSLDGYKRMIIDEIIRQYFPSKIYNHLNDYIHIDFAEIETKIVCHIKIKRSEQRVFLKLNDKEIFMIRIDSENRPLEGEKLVDYCIKHFKN